MPTDAAAGGMTILRREPHCLTRPKPSCSRRATRPSPLVESPRRAGLPNAIHYYFETMDDLFIEVFRRGATRSLARQEEVLDSPQPLWAFWDFLLDRSNGDLNMELIALANHRKAIRSEIAESSRIFRRGQLAALTGVIEATKPADGTRSPEAIILLLSAVSRFLTTEDAFDLDTGHLEVIELVEECIREVEGDRPTR